MNRLMRFVGPLAMSAALAIGACSGEAEIDADSDTTASGETMDITPADSGLPTNADANPTDAPDTVVDTGAKGDAEATDADGGGGNEAVEKLVEAQLMISPGFADVKVESEGDGIIVLTGAVTSAEEKANAESEAKKIVGVKSVRNELTVR